MKNIVKFAHALFDFISLYLFALTFAMKLKDANYKSHWKILLFCDQLKIMSDLNMPHEKMSDFDSFVLFGFTLVIKLRNFDFESHWNTLIFFDKKMISDWLCLVKQFLIWFKLHWLSRILALSWEMRISNFIEVVSDFSIQESFIRSKSLSFFLLCVCVCVCVSFFSIFEHYYRNSFELNKFLMTLRSIEIL